MIEDEYNIIISNYADYGESINILLKNNKKIIIDFPKDEHINYTSNVSSDSQIITVSITHEKLIHDDCYSTTEKMIYINPNEIVAIIDYPLKNYEHPRIYIE